MGLFFFFRWLHVVVDFIKSTNTLENEDKTEHSVSKTVFFISVHVFAVTFASNQESKNQDDIQQLQKAKYFTIFFYTLTCDTEKNTGQHEKCVLH